MKVFNTSFIVNAIDFFSTYVDFPFTYISVISIWERWLYLAGQCLDHSFCRQTYSVQLFFLHLSFLTNN